MAAGALMDAPRTFRAGFLFAGLGAGARGFLAARAHLGDAAARFVSVGGIDVDAEACSDFRRLTGSAALEADVATITPAALRAAWGDTAPDCVFLSPPCKGFSRLLGRAQAAGETYQRLNRLVLQGVFLLCEAWPDAPPPTIVLENVPGIETRGATLLHQVRELLTRAGYRLHEGRHDCGEIGGLGQHRRRFLLVARRPAVVPAYIYRPPIQRVKGCGEILDALPLPLGTESGPLHALPRITLLARMVSVGIVGGLVGDCAEWLGDPIGHDAHGWGRYVYGIIVGGTMPWVWRPFDR